MLEPPAALRDVLANLTGELRIPCHWPTMLQLASNTLTIGLLASRFLQSELASEIPPNIRDLLEDVLARARARNDRMRAQFAELLPVLNAVGIEPIAMRGISHLVSGDGSDGRLLSDIDLLLPVNQRSAAIAALESIGYRILQGNHGPPFSAVLGRETDVGMVDIHTDIQPYWLGVDHARAAKLCNRAEIGGAVFSLPDPTAALLFNTLHDQLHDGDYWRGLIDARHLVDIPALVQRGVDWQALSSFFPPGCATNALHLYLRTATSLLDVDIPRELCGGLRTKAQMARRLLQLRFPSLRPAFTLQALMLDPPPRSGVSASPGKRLKRKFKFKAARALGDVNPGKFSMSADQIDD